MKSLLIPLSLLFAAVAHAAAPPVQVRHARSFPTPAPGVPGVGFLTLVSPVADRLVSAESPNIGRIEIHQSSMKGGVMQMRALPNGLALPAGETVALAPGGLHLMLFGLKEPLAVGMRLPLTLRFEKAGAVTTELVVELREPVVDHSTHVHP